MALTIEISSKSIIITHFKNVSMEQNTSIALTAKVDGSTVNATWKVTPNGLLQLVPWSSDIAGLGQAFSAGTGFGKSTVYATYGDQVPASLDIYVGTVVIFGGDGSYWQVFPDGSTQPVLAKDIHPDANTLIRNNAILSDLTTNSTSTAVTCYLLNLESFTLKPK